jgi:hypothetical protein
MTEADFEPYEPRDGQLFQLVWDAAVVGRELLLKAIEGGATIYGHWRFPSLSYFESGIPNISTSTSWAGPPDYDNAFAAKESQFTKAVIYGEIPEFRALIDYVKSQEQYVRFFVGYKKDHIRMTFMDMFAAGLATGLLARYLHVHGTEQELVKELFLDLYGQRERPLVEEKLPVEVVVPIALTMFEGSESLRLTSTLRVEPIDEKSQLARYPSDSLWTDVHNCVLAGATHAAVFENYEVPSQGVWDRGVFDVDFYPTEVIDRFFTALRVETGIETGYAQIVLRPLGWTYEFNAHLPNLIKGPQVRAYPPQFDKHGWLVKRDPLSAKTVLSAGKVFEGICSAGESVSLAGRRLSQAMLRPDETDAVVDACIGLEALLGDDSPVEMTHKVALRVAAMHTLLKPDIEPVGVFRMVKKLYTYRSKLVHGRTDVAKHRYVDAGQSIRTLDAGIGALRNSIKALVNHPQFQDPLEVDAGLMRARLPS